MFWKFRNRTQIVALALMMAIAALCAAALVQPAMALAGGQDCSGPACDDQIACGQPTQPQATSSPSIGFSLVAVDASVSRGLIEVNAWTTTAPPILATPASRPFAPFAPRSPPAA